MKAVFVKCECRGCICRGSQTAEASSGQEEHPGIFWWSRPIGPANCTIALLPCRTASTMKDLAKVDITFDTLLEFMHRNCQFSFFFFSIFVGVPTSCWRVSWFALGLLTLSSAQPCVSVSLRRHTVAPLGNSWFHTSIFLSHLLLKCQDLAPIAHKGLAAPSSKFAIYLC